MTRPTDEQIAVVLREAAEKIIGADAVKRYWPTDSDFLLDRDGGFLAARLLTFADLLTEKGK